jgi:hypothetical protein
LDFRTWFGICFVFTDRWYSPGIPVSSTNKTDRHDITQILLKVALNTTKKKQKQRQKQTTNKQH